MRLSPETIADLDVAPVVQALRGHELRRERFVTSVLTESPMDPDVITYRAQVVANLLDDPGLRRRLADVLPQLSRLAREPERPMFGFEWTVGQIVQRLGELELYVDAATSLDEALEASALRAPALHALGTSVHALVSSPEFEALRAELPALRAHLDEVQSITIGVNLSSDLRPESAAILSIDSKKIEGRGGLLERLLGHEAARRGITQLRGRSGTSLRALFPPMQVDAQGRHNDLVQDLRRLLERVMAPVGEVIERYVWVHTRAVADLESELSFLLNAVALIERLRAAGLPMCRPEIRPIAERVSYLEEGYNVSLALRMMQAAATPRESTTGGIVTNPMTFDEEHGRVWVLTGPNRGGKTTYARAVGLAHLLFQAGLYVPACTARMSPVDAIYTHFPSVEGARLGEGRLDEEAVRLAEIFRQATPHSLILLNEVLSGTSTLEALGLAYDAVRGLRLLGARAIYVTHLHELATRVDEINATTGSGGTVGSLVAGVEDERGSGEGGHRRTFRICPGRPHGLSYASEIAEQHGISYPQLARLLKDRGLVADV
jgi:DNA mismatch repair protein MutS